MKRFVFLVSGIILACLGAIEGDTDPENHVQIIGKDQFSKFSAKKIRAVYFLKPDLSKSKSYCHPLSAPFISVFIMPYVSTFQFQQLLSPVQLTPTGAQSANIGAHSGAYNQIISDNNR